MRKALSILIAAAVISFPALAGELSGVAPDFTLQSRNGDQVSLSDLRGNVVMINFWATWKTRDSPTGSCRKLP
jgi:cytochrome oxidase Cu insertion factor (SCO1/SenC/PrrC family)